MNNFRSGSNFPAISARFATRRGRFDYESFFGRLITTRNDNDSNGDLSPAASVPPASNQSPTKRKAAKSAASSPTKHEQQRLEKLRVSDAGPTDNSESDAQPSALPTMRVDRLLEIQQRLQASIRKKLLLGMTGGRREGYLGVEDALFQLDPNGDGFLPLRVFTDDILARLKMPLTKSESDFLLAQLQTRGKVSDEKGVDYEQLRPLFDVDSEDTASESDVDAAGHDAGTCPSPTRVSQLGAEYLAAEKRLSEFLRSPMNPNDSVKPPNSAFETPRSIYTGAERFLELSEAIDKEKTGALDEKCASKSRFRSSRGLVLMLSRILARFRPCPGEVRRRNTGASHPVDAVAVSSGGARPRQLLVVPPVRQSLDKLVSATSLSS